MVEVPITELAEVGEGLIVPDAGGVCGVFIDWVGGETTVGSCVTIVIILFSSSPSSYYS